MKTNVTTYYSILRPVSLGTFPKQGCLDFENFEERTYIEEIGRGAWGKLYYNRKLTPEEKIGYDLVEGK